MSPVGASSLADLVARCRRVLRRRAGGGAVVWAIGVFALILPVAWLLVGTEGWRPGSPLPLLLVAAGGIAALGAALLGWRRGARWAREDRLSRQMEEGATLADGQVRAQLELGRGVSSGGSATLARAGEQALLARLARGADRIVREGHRETGRLLRSGAALAVGAVVLAVALLVTTPDRARTAWAGLASPLGVLLPEPLPPLAVTPGNTGAPRGDQVSVGVEAPGRDGVTLHWEMPGELPGSRALAVTDGRTESRLPPLRGALDYWVTAPDGARSGPFRIEPEDPLLLSDILVEVHQPSYLARPIERYTSMPEALQLPVGSELRISGRASNEVGELRLRDRDGRVAMRMEVSDAEFRGTWRPNAGGEFVWEADPVTPSGSRLPDPLELELVADAPPRVELSTDGRTDTFPVSLRLPLEILASDDRGLDWVELQVRTGGAEGAGAPPVQNRTPAEGRRDVALRPVLDVSNWGLEPGSVLRIRARAADRAPVPGVGESSEIVLRLPDAEELRTGARDRVDQTARELDSLAERARDGEEALRDRAREQARAEGRSGGSDTGGQSFERREELRSALEEQGALAREVEALRDELSRARESLGTDEADRSLARRMEDLERLLDEVGGEDAARQMQELADELAQGADPESSSTDVDAAELSERQEVLREQLEEAVERFRRAALETEFEGAEEEVRSLQVEQEALAEELAGGADGSADAQEELGEQAGELDERLAELEERLRDEGAPEAAERVGTTREGVEGARQSMQEAAESARAGEPAQSGEQGSQAADELSEAMEEMESARMDWLAEWEEEVRAALLRGAQDALALSRAQGELRRELRTAGSERQQDLLAREAVLIESIRNLATFMGVATRQAGGVGREISLALSEALSAVERASEGLRSGSTPRAGPFAAAGEAETALNEAAMIALEGMDRIGEPPPPGAAQELAEELEGLAGEQESMNQDASSLSQDPGAEGAAARMEELAGAQEAMAGALGEVAEQFGGEPGGEALPEMAEEAARIAEELGEGRLDAETLDRQASLLERLLEAGRSLERDGPTEEREGTAAGAVDRPDIRALPPGLLQGSRIPLPSSAILDGLSPAERRLVFDYFERLNRMGGGGR